MSRRLESWVTDDTEGLLGKLNDQRTDSSEYRRTMYELGMVFGHYLLSELRDTSSITLASTAEDVDFLGKGIIDVLEKHGKKVLLTVFWNKRFKPNKENNLSIAPIIREFHEQGYDKADILLIIKSIIANSCVVRTNLTKLIEGSDPKKIFIIAPVLLKGAIKNLENEFDEKISKRFDYLYIAEDSEKNSEGIVLPGIGGDVYERLGFGTQDMKNRFVPELVRERRHKY